MVSQRPTRSSCSSPGSRRLAGLNFLWHGRTEGDTAAAKEARPKLRPITGPRVSKAGAQAVPGDLRGIDADPPGGALDDLRDRPAGQPVSRSPVILPWSTRVKSGAATHSFLICSLSS